MINDKTPRPSLRQQFRMGAVTVRANSKEKFKALVNKHSDDNTEVYLAASSYGKIFKYLFTKIKPKIIKASIQV